MKNLKNQKGITLVALIITIIVLIILAAVTIISVNNMQLVPLAINGTQNYSVAQENEGKLVNDITDLVLSAVDNIESWEYFKETKTVNGENGTSKNPTIPKGFRPISTPGAVWKKTGDQTDYNNGLVIEDTEGNQFVWVPCYVEGGETVDKTVTEYKQHVYAGTAEKTDDTGAIIEDSGDGGWKTNFYTKFGNNWKDDASTYGVESVKKYGGFWIGRYEAGVPENASFYSKGEDGENYVYGSSKKNVTKETKDGQEIKLKPVSKQEYLSWNFINQKNAITLSEQMYEENDSIDSILIDSYAWDTVTQWISDTGQDLEGKKVNVVDSRKHGNYLDNQSDYMGKYVEHLMVGQNQIGVGNAGWIYANKITDNAITLEWKRINSYSDIINGRFDQTNITNGTYNETDNFFDTRIEIPTGSYKNSKLNNIYDLAGNMWEWTTEVGDLKTDDDQTNIMRTSCGC